MENIENTQQTEQEDTGETTETFFGRGVLTGLFLGLALSLLGYILFVKDKTGADATVEEASGQQASIANDHTMSKIRAVEQLIKSHFYLSEVDDSQLEEGIYDGMVDSLGDKYAAYYTPEELVEATQENKGIYYGIGAYLSIDNETSFPFLQGIIPETPAEEAGLQRGDIILEIDGESAYQMSLKDVVDRVKGEEFTTVMLTILRGEERLEVEVERRKVDTPTVKSEMLEEDIGYISIQEFDQVTANQFAKEYESLKQQDVRALIIDLRGNPGGVLDTAVQIGRELLPSGLIVYTEDKAGNRAEYTCDGTKEIKIPLVVLVDGGSASASEVLTGAIKDYGVGTIMGTKTFGKGIVQKVFTVSDGSAVKMTISGYYTPKGNNIHGIGIEPDVEVPFDAKAYYTENPEDRVDNQKEAAISYLKEKLK